MSKQQKTTHSAPFAVSCLTLSGSRQNPEHRTKYIYDGWRVIQERDVNSNPTVSYTRGPDLSGSLEGAGGIGGLLARSSDYSSGNPTSHAYYHADGNGNVTCLLDVSQNVAASYYYDPYGNLLSFSGTLALDNAYQFSSKEYMANSRLYYYGYRFYDPDLQRWLNRDPFGEPGFEILRIHNAKVIHFLSDIAELAQKPDLYEYVENSPASSRDSSGLKKDSACAAKCKQNLKNDEESALERGGACLGMGMAGCREEGAEEAFPVCVLTVVSFCSGFEAGLQTAALASYAGCMSGCPDSPSCPSHRDYPLPPHRSNPPPPWVWP